MIKNKVRGLGEVILRVNDMRVMKEFYNQTVGLELIHESANNTFEANNYKNDEINRIMITYGCTPSCANEPADSYCQSVRRHNSMPLMKVH